jgi:hypothetical protein
MAEKYVNNFTNDHNIIEHYKRPTNRAYKKIKLGLRFSLEKLNLGFELLSFYYV